MKKYIISALLLCGMVQVANAQGYYIYKNGVKQTVLATEMDSLVFFKEEEKAPDTPVTVFGLFEVSPAMGRIIDAFPAILVFITPFLMFYEIPYVVKDIFTSLKNRIAD